MNNIEFKALQRQLADMHDQKKQGLKPIMPPITRDEKLAIIKEKIAHLKKPSIGDRILTLTAVWTVTLFYWFTEKPIRLVLLLLIIIIVILL